MMMKRHRYLLLLIFSKTYLLCAQIPDGFSSIQREIEGIMLEPRYKTENNFTGRVVEGYQILELMLTVETINALQAAQKEFNEKGFSIKIFDAYRPQKAVNYFIEWAKDQADTLRKNEYYPHLKKSELFPLGYIAERSGHSRGSTVDLTLVYFDNENTPKEVDMGSSYDYFGEESHVFYEQITDEQKEARRYLRKVMLNNGFKPYAKEWWHFTLKNEPYPNTYFDH